ncbi:MAG: hypothetical protein ACP5D7_09305 [Limnospira sp.]
MNDGIECPKCGKRTVINRREDLFECINCEFKRDFSKQTKKTPPRKPSENNSPLDNLIPVLITILILVALGL